MKTVYLSDVNNPCVLKEAEMWCIKMLFFTCTHAVIIINEHKPYSFQNHVGLTNITRITHDLGQETKILHNMST